MARGLIVGERERQGERAGHPSGSQSETCVFAADPYILAQHFLNLSSVFSGHK